MPTVCDFCEEIPPQVRVTLTDLEGVVLDELYLCAECRAEKWTFTQKRIAQA